MASKKQSKKAKPSTSTSTSKLGASMVGKYVVVRTYSAGVHMGVLAARDGREVLLTDTRRLWSWSGAFTLSAVAQNGVAQGSRLSRAQPEILLTEAIEVAPCSAEAEASLRAFPEHKP